MRKMADKMNNKFETHKSIIGNRKSQISSPIHSSTHLPINPSSFLFKTNPILYPTILLNLGIYPLRADLFTRIRRLFLNNCKKMRTLCNFLTLTHLTTCTTKTYINILPGIRGTGHERRVTIKMQNKPNLTPSTHSLIHSFTHPPILFFMQNKPNCNPTPVHLPPAHGPRVTRDESRLNMQNEPNFSPTLNPTWFTGNLRASSIKNRASRICKTNPTHIGPARPTGHGPRVTNKNAKRTQFADKHP
jgi:hypothetical protein